MPMIAQPMMMPSNQAPAQQDFESKANQLKEANQKEIEKIRAEITEITEKQNEQIGTLTVRTANKSNKQELEALKVSLNESWLHSYFRRE